ncbi:hypothetical protein LTR70_003429 [Exophiala xenobiotica]|uniref:Uncharacterized protein n=1 Tax=Lithohypha guttulata TaxID=1690604 RepID=A0ABR0KGH7_9EURO|nr:hypothetical protein LTR24_002976 [Lithohypha guttulata]KAK5323567.1 hypothetical protein LTR70_003429 [Exophiala xenobiotica]
MAGPQDGNETGTSPSSDDHLIASVINDIVDYKIKSFAMTSSQNFDASGYHPYDRQIGGAESDTYQTSSTPAYEGYRDSSANQARDSAQSSAGYSTQRGR